MVLEGIDLTIESIFAADHNPGLLIRDAWNYHQNNRIEDKRREFLGHTNSELRYFRENLIVVESDLDLRRNKFEEECEECFYNLFNMDRRGRTDPYSEMGNRDCCDRCGRTIHLLNSVLGLCEQCDLETSGENSQFQTVDPSTVHWEIANLPIPDITATIMTTTGSTASTTWEFTINGTEATVTQSTNQTRALTVLDNILRQSDIRNSARLGF